MGRLTLLRSVIINLNAEYRWQPPIGVNGTRSAPNRDHIWRDWYVSPNTPSEMHDTSRCKRQLMPPIFVYLSTFELVKRTSAQRCLQVYHII